MTDDPFDPTPDPTPEAPEPAPKAKSGVVIEAPADVDEDRATGYAVYDTTLGQFVGGVTAKKPSATDAKAAVVKGHTHKVVRV